MNTNCMACGTPVNPVELAMAAEDNYPIHLKCVQARHRATLRHKCVCRTRKYAKRAGAAPGQRGRAWLACTRCLGQIEQLQ